MSNKWSTQIADAYQLEVPEDVAVWVDDNIWQENSGREFRYPLTPEQILSPSREWIWPGFMLPDTLPLVGNQYGDWLCLRVGWDGTVTEVVYWCHGGGDWIPYGRTFAEALLYDAAFQRIYKDRLPDTDPDERESVVRSAQWATGWLGEDRAIEPFWDHDAPATADKQLLELLVSKRIGEVAARRDLILKLLETPLRRNATPSIAEKMGTNWEPEFVSWMFDSALIPELRKADLSKYLDVPVSELTEQDWNEAEQHARKVMEQRSDLGWAFDIVGWANERRGDISGAIACYRKGVLASSFSDETVRFRTHWFPEGLGKFAAARLYQLRDELDSETRADPYLQLWWENDPESLRSRVRDFWFDRANQATGEPVAAFRDYYRAGWDLGLQYQHSYQEVLDAMIAAATAGGAHALARVVTMHRDLL